MLLNSVLKLAPSVVFALVCITGARATAQEKESTLPALEFRKWSGDINVPDPVGLSLDNQGRVYVTQTKRRKIQDLDIREHRSWIPNDVGLRTIEDKRAFFKQVLAIGGDQAVQSQQVGDWNQDGQHDWRDLTVVSEVIYRLVDTDDDQTADEITIFADNFKTEVTGIAAGVLAYDGEVFATVAPDLWKLIDHNGDGRADSQVSIAHGFGLHIAYGGHDMHGPTVGPDGRIYWSIGDKGINVTTADGQTFAFPDQGGVMRCNPDGSDFEVFAHGLRNVQEVAFDQYGNMFGVDNDSDQPGEKERFVYIVDGMDAGWRNFYQYRGENYNPWTDESLWDLPGSEHPAYIVPPLGHYVDGPAGFKFNPGTALSADFQNYFFLTSAPNGFQYAFRIEPQGDAFKMVNAQQIGSGLAIVGLAFGPDGALYGADWDGGYPLDEKGSVIRIDVPAEQADPQRKQVRELLAAGFEQREKSELIALLAHADQRVRLGAQFALVRQDAGDLLAAVARDEGANQFARLHALWGLGQLARRGDTLGRDTLGLLLRDNDPLIKSQAAKAYGEIKSADGTPLVKLLADDHPQVRVLAGLAVARQPTDKALSVLLEQADKLKPDEHYVRHAIVSALAKCGTAEQLAAEVAHENELRRLCCVLALRRQANPQVSQFLDDKSNWVATAAARAIYDDESIPAALPRLAQALTSRDQPNEPFCRRAINANFRLGDPPSAQRLLQFAMDDGQSPLLRRIALEVLSGWKKPDVLDGVQGIYRLLPVEDRDFDASTLVEGIAELVEVTQGELRSAALAVAQELGLPLPLDTLAKLVTDESVEIETRVRALDTVVRKTQDLVNAASKSESAVLRIRALEVFNAGQGARENVSRIKSILEHDPAVSAKQAAVAMLAREAGPEAVELLQELGNKLLQHQLDSRLSLEVLEAIQLASQSHEQLAGLASQLAEHTSMLLGERLARFAYSRDGGNAAQGEVLFRSHVQAQCSRCHRIGRRGSEIGPELTNIAAQRDADYLLRSILKPSADIDPKYRSQMILLDSGQILKGVIQSQDGEQVVIADANGELTTVSQDEIEATTEQNVSLMPEMTEILTPSEVRDLVAYLRTLKEGIGKCEKCLPAEIPGLGGQLHDRRAGCGGKPLARATGRQVA